MAILIRDAQSRITRYGMKCYQIIDGMRCQAFASAKKVGNNLIIPESFSDCIDQDGNSVAGVYKIITIDAGKIGSIVCEKIK